MTEISAKRFSFMGCRRRGGIPEAKKGGARSHKGGASRPNSEQDEGLGPVLRGVYLVPPQKAPPTLASGIPAAAATSMKKSQKSPHQKWEKRAV